jgi:hypothetical protein
MAATPDRTTIKAAIKELTAKLRADLVADPPTAGKPFRRVEAGSAEVQEHPRPFLTLLLTRTRPVGATDGDRIVEVSMMLRVVTDVAALDPHDGILDRIGAVEDCFDSLLDGGVIDGSEGFDDREWTFDYPRATAGSRVASATAAQTFIVKVQREHNREPAS